MVLLWLRQKQKMLKKTKHCCHFTLAIRGMISHSFTPRGTELEQTHCMLNCLYSSNRLDKAVCGNQNTNTTRYQSPSFSTYRFLSQRDHQTDWIWKGPTQQRDVRASSQRTVCSRNATAVVLLHCSGKWILSWCNMWIDFLCTVKIPKTPNEEWANTQC